MSLDNSDANANTLRAAPPASKGAVTFPKIPFSADPHVGGPCVNVAEADIDGFHGR